MRKFALLGLAAVFAAATVAPVSFAGFEASALAAKAKKEKKKKDVAGKCGTMKYFDKKKKACVSK